MYVYTDHNPEEVFAVRITGLGFIPEAYPGEVLIVDRATSKVLAIVRLYGDEQPEMD